VALFSKVYNGAPEYIGGKVQQNRYTVADPFIPGIVYDAFQTQECVPIPNSGGRSAIKSVFKYKGRLAVPVSPRVDATHPAILALAKGA
jgi:hypothetical protein